MTLKIKYLLPILLIICYTPLHAEDCSAVKEINGTSCAGIYFPSEIEYKARAEHSILLQERVKCEEVDVLQRQEVTELEGKSTIWQKEAEKQAELAQKNADGFKHGMWTGIGVSAVVLTVLKVLVGR